MTTPVDIDVTDTTDSTSAGSTKNATASDETKEGTDPKASDPKVRNALSQLRNNLSDDLDKSSETLDKANGGARNFEEGDATATGSVNGVNANNSTSSGGGGGTPRLSGAQLGGTNSAMPAPAAFNPMQYAAPAMQTAASVAAPMSTAMATPASAPASSSNQVALTPTQQAALASAVSNSDSGGGGGVTDKSAPGGNTNAPSSGNGKFDSVVKDVLSKNLPYAWGGGTLEGPSKGISDGGGAADANGDYNKVGYDCSGLSRYLTYQDTGVEIPRTSQAQYAAATPVTDPKPGDLVFPASSLNGGSPTHVQVYVGEGKVIHAPQSGDNVQIAELSEGAEIRRPT